MEGGEGGTNSKATTYSTDQSDCNGKWNKEKDQRVTLPLYDILPFSNKGDGKKKGGGPTQNSLGTDQSDYNGKWDKGIKKKSECAW